MSEKIKKTHLDSDGHFHYIFEFSTGPESLFSYRDMIPVDDKDKEIVELYKHIFEQELRKYLNQNKDE